jgi:hypothetical protein
MRVSEKTVLKYTPGQDELKEILRYEVSVEP